MSTFEVILALIVYVVSAILVDVRLNQTEENAKNADGKLEVFLGYFFMFCPVFNTIIALIGLRGMWNDRRLARRFK